MRKSLGLLGGLLLAACAASASPCTPSATSLCLAGGRFEVSVAWSAQNKTGDGQAVSLTADTGYFWFFTDSNVELIVKVLDATAINGRFWVFFGALSNVEYTLTVRDGATGATKTYHNPSGQFASVGDTQAFSGNVDAPPTTESVVVQGTAAPSESIEAVRHLVDRAARAVPAAAPCPSDATDLLLSGCRFRVRASWEDSQGHTGDGQAVPLTGDTGYFWFFSHTNVELMVKVLDARPINGKFWVFFGALSNVAYTVTVYDTATGTTRRYTNEAGTFASVGDTAAFSAGRSVVAVPDAAQGVRQGVDALGATLTATGADGTTYTLAIPANAILFPTTVTMTPLDHVDGFPFSGGLKGGVQLGPEGLILWQPAILTISPVTPIPPAQLLPFAYAGTGENFILYPTVPNKPDMELVVSHFSGYGAGAGNSADAAAQLGITPSGPFAPYVQRAARVQFLQQNDQIDFDTGKEEMIQIFTDAFNEVVLPTLQSTQECDVDTISAAANLMISWGHQAGDFLPDEAFSSLLTSGMQELKRIAQHCIDVAFEKCVTQNDTGQVRMIMAIARTLQFLGLVNDAEYDDLFGKVERCLRFEVDFDSSIELTTEEAVFSQKVEAIAPVRLDGGQSGFFLSGEGTIHTLLATVSPSGSNPCSYETEVTDSEFEVTNLSPGGPERDAYDVAMHYAPGTPQEDDKLHCPMVPDQDGGFHSQWAPEFTELHLDELEVPFPAAFTVRGWDIIPTGNFVAKKLYERSGSIGGGSANESTHIFLKHTPDAPLP